MLKKHLAGRTYDLENMVTKQVITNVLSWHMRHLHLAIPVEELELLRTGVSIPLDARVQAGIDEVNSKCCNTQQDFNSYSCDIR